MDELSHDLRYGLRQLRARPGFTAAAVLSLGLGIGSVATLFTCVNALFLAPLPVEEPDRLVGVFTRDEGSPRLLPTSHPNFLDFRERARTLSGMAAYRTVSLSLGTETREVVFGELVSPDYFEVLGVEAALGRTFSSQDGEIEGGHPVVVLGHGLWQRRFGGDRELVGREIQLNGRPFTVVGVLPEAFQGIERLDSPQLWVPTWTRGAVLTGGPARGFDARDIWMFQIVGRLAPGSTRAQARAEVEALMAALVQEYPEANEDLGVDVLPVADVALGPELRRTLLRASWILGAAAALLLLTACANLAGLLLARSVTRRQEIAVRLAAGARRADLVRQLLTESVLLSTAGGAAGLLVAFWGSRLLWALRPPFLTGSLEPALDWRVLAFALLLSLATGVAFGLAPAVQACRVDPVAALHDRSGSRLGGSGGRRLLGTLVAGQVALALIALVGAGLFTASLRNVSRVDPGFRVDGLFILPLDLGAAGYERPAALDVYRRLAERIGSLPGVRSATVGERPLLAPGGPRYDVAAENRRQPTEDGGRLVPINRVGTGYFETVGIPVLRGRSFTRSDRDDGRPVAVVNETLAELLWPGEEAVGRRLRFTEPAAPFDVPVEVVGVAGNASYHRLNEEDRPYLYLPVLQAYTPRTILHLRATGALEEVVPRVRGEIGALDPSLPLLEGRVVADLLRRQFWAPRMLAGLLGAFGGLALVLAVVGVFGVVSYAGNARRRDIGIRLAMGAARGRVAGEVFRRGMVPVVAGVAVGLAGALAAAPATAAFLFELSAFDPGVFAVAASVLAAAGALAVLVPARRAISVPPATVLRTD